MARKGTFLITSVEQIKQTSWSFEMMKTAYTDHGYRQLLTDASTVLVRSASVCEAFEEEERRLEG